MRLATPACLLFDMMGFRMNAGVDQQKSLAVSINITSSRRPVGKSQRNDAWLDTSVCVECCSDRFCSYMRIRSRALRWRKQGKWTVHSSQTDGELTTRLQELER